MPLSNQQHGVIAENEFAKLLMMGSGGKIELAAPLTDEERRDFEIHVHGQYGSGLAVQVKSTLALILHGRKTRYLHTFFAVPSGRVVNHPLYWYFVAYLDPRLMGFGEPTFLIPSSEFHKQASPIRRGDVCRFTFQACMEPNSRDKWYPYRLGTLDLGNRVLEIMRQLKKRREPSLQATRILSLPDAVWVRPRRRA